MKMIEVWKKVKGYEDIYEVSNKGRVRRLNPFRYLKGNLGSMGYWVFSFRKPGQKKKDIRLHRLLATHFIPNPNKYKCVDHIDGNKLNNELSNLRWCTRGQNVSFAFKNGLIDRKGEKHEMSKLNRIQVLEIRRLYSEGYSQNQIKHMMDLPVRRRHISDIVNRKVWGWLEPKQEKG